MWVSHSGSAREHMHSTIFAALSHLQSKLGGGLPLQIDDLAAVVFHFGGVLGGLAG